MINSILDALSLHYNQPVEAMDPKSISGRVQEWLGAKPSTQGDIVQQALGQRLKPTGQDIGKAAFATLVGGKPVGGQDIADERLAGYVNQLSDIRKVQTAGMGGGTGELIAQLRAEDPSLTFSQALQRVQSGYRQGWTTDASGNAIEIPGLAGIKGNFKLNEGYGSQKGQNTADIEDAANIERQKLTGKGEVPEIEKANLAKSQMSDIIDDMRASYQELGQKGGITSTQNGWLDNVGARISSSGIGQAVGTLGGTEEARIRSDIYAKIPLLMSAIKSATGKSASEINSIPEMQLLKQSVTDPKQPLETVMKQLDDLQKLYTNPSQVQPLENSIGGVIDFNDLPD